MKYKWVLQVEWQKIVVIFPGREVIYHFKQRKAHIHWLRRNTYHNFLFVPRILFSNLNKFKKSKLCKEHTTAKVGVHFLSWGFRYPSTHYGKWVRKSAPLFRGRGWSALCLEMQIMDVSACPSLLVCVFVCLFVFHNSFVELLGWWKVGMKVGGGGGACLQWDWWR